MSRSSLVTNIPQKNTISIVNIEDNISSKGYKARLAYILKTNGIVIQCFQITPKYETKPNHIKPYLMEILDWRDANLHEDSWINTFDIYNLSVEDVKVKFVGNLSERDTERLVSLLRENKKTIRNPNE